MGMNSRPILTSGTDGRPRRWVVPCVDCGGEVTIGKRGRLPLRCPECKQDIARARSEKRNRLVSELLKAKPGWEPRQPFQIVSDEKIEAIAKLLSEGIAQRAIAVQVGISQSPLNRIIKRDPRLDGVTKASRKCVECGVDYGPHLKGKQRVFCSDKCRRREANRRLGRQYKVNKAKFLLDTKRRPCPDCGIWWPPEAMDFDHLDPDTKHPSLRMLVTGQRNSRGMSHLAVVNLPAEIAKCEVVCACCHRIRTAKRRREALAAREAS